MRPWADERSDVKFCDCPCGRQLLGTSPANLELARRVYGREMPEPVAGRVSEWGGHRLVPYCAWCFAQRRAVGR